MHAGACVPAPSCGRAHCFALVHQSLELQKRPHVVIATPGRLHDHLRGASAPNLSKVGGACHARAILIDRMVAMQTPFLVLDEADRLLAPSARVDHD